MLRPGLKADVPGGIDMDHATTLWCRQSTQIHVGMAVAGGPPRSPGCRCRGTRCPGGAFAWAIPRG